MKKMLSLMFASGLVVMLVTNTIITLTSIHGGG